MIHGSVTGLQARINIVLRPPGQPDVEIECVVDTGFEGAITLPPNLVAAFGLQYFTRISANLADDTNVMTQMYVATIMLQFPMETLHVGTTTALSTDSRVDFV